MKPVLFDIFKNENLTLPMLILKRIGQVGFSLLLLSVIIVQLNQGKAEGSLLLDIAVWAGGTGFFVGIACFAIVGLFSLGKNKKNSTIQAVGGSFLKVFLYIFLPAIIITAIITFTVVLPGN